MLGSLRFIQSRSWFKIELAKSRYRSNVLKWVSATPIVFVLQKVLPRSLIVVEKESGVEMKNTLVEPSTEHFTPTGFIYCCRQKSPNYLLVDLPSADFPAAMATSYKKKEAHSGVSAISQEVAVACPIA